MRAGESHRLMISYHNSLNARKGESSDLVLITWTSWPLACCPSLLDIASSSPAPVLCYIWLVGYPSHNQEKPRKFHHKTNQGKRKSQIFGGHLKVWEVYISPKYFTGSPIFSFWTQVKWCHDLGRAIVHMQPWQPRHNKYSKRETKVK